MMSTASPWASALASLKASEPEWAMVPRFSSSSASVMPMPLSETVMVRASLSKATLMARLAWSRPIEESVRLLR